jgi:molybdate transport system regulatory protein
MAEKFKKYSNLNLHYSIWMTTKEGDNAISDQRLQLLIAINSLGSLRAASLHMGISYRKAWGDLRATEKLLGFQLIEKHRGGKDGGTSMLTEDGVKLVNAYNVFSAEFQEAVDKVIIKFKKTIKQG